MKKLAIIFSSLLLVCFSLSACSLSLDFSDTIEGKMDELYNTIRDKAEPFLKEDSSYNEGESTLPEQSPTVPGESEGEVNEG